MTVFLHPFRGKEVSLMSKRTGGEMDGVLNWPPQPALEAGAARHRSGAAFTFVAVLGQSRGRLWDDAFWLNALRENTFSRGGR
jgi:hypothetical protein